MDSTTLQQQSPRPRDAPPAYTAPSVPLVPPPDYETAITGDPSVFTTQHEVASHEPITLRIEGKYIYTSASKSPIYSLTHALDGYELNATGILLTRIDSSAVRRVNGRPPKRDVFALRDASPLRIGPAKYEIDGVQYLSGKRGYMTRSIHRNGQGWSVGGRGLPSFALRPMVSESGALQYEWRDRMSDHYIATETRRQWNKDTKSETTPPTLELRIGKNVDKGYLDFLVAAWCMHNWREAKEITKEPLTWDECKLCNLSIFVR